MYIYVYIIHIYELKSHKQQQRNFHRDNPDRKAHAQAADCPVWKGKMLSVGCDRRGEEESTEPGGTKVMWLLSHTWIKT